MTEMSFKYNLLQSVAISHRTEHESYDEDHGHDGVLAWVVLPPWYWCGGDENDTDDNDARDYDDDAMVEMLKITIVMMMMAEMMTGKARCQQLHPSELKNAQGLLLEPSGPL